MTLEERLEASAASAVTAVPPVVAAAAPAPAPVAAAAPVREEPVSVKVPAEVKPLPEAAPVAAAASVKTAVAAKADDQVPTLESEGKLRVGQDEDMPTVVQSSAEVEKALKSAKDGKKASALELAQAAAAEAPKVDASAPIDAPIAKTTSTAPAKKAEEPKSKTGFYLAVAIMLGLVVVAILKVFEIIKF